ncbi:cell envelope integrity protein TolA [Marinomonas algarum]|uniref:Cell envelope integrity protein TolA n=1 Tax=Marinomonas algarum TaxID=2883105 RepID=A0A9X1LER5_9GAMM|nr:cell envelope integrity protein TolA [Marinomonas algarum]MCB5161906.1 cell envelope integrity protein TolA [Marinomonas algarum]
MMKWLRTDSYSLPVVLAVGLHVGVLGVGLVAVDFNDADTPVPKRPPIVNATVVDVSQTIIGKREVEERAAQQRAAQVAVEKKKREAEKAKQKRETERKALEEKKRQVAQAKQAREKAEAQRRESDRQKAAAEKKQRLAEQEKQRLAQQAEKQRQAKEKAEKKRREEVARQAEADRLAEQERQRQEEASRLAAKEKAREEAEAARVAAAKEAEERAVAEAQMVQSISSLINNRVTSAWIRPPSARNNMKTQLRIYFLPNGEVMNVQITKGSGDALFDQRAVDAVYKVRRIEELADVDSYVFERNFRQVDLIFNPQDLRN